MYVSPFEFDTCYSVALTANQPVNNCWICTVATACRYVGAPIEDPATNVTTSVIPLVETNLHPVGQPHARGLPVPDGTDVTLNLVIMLAHSTLQYSSLRSMGPLNPSPRPRLCSTKS
ncbi:hypothetical protein C8R44DRAFT_893907 [Mycena epipterygia]|nr:hypothetical protein C8R44DRAFT_893907 [Mycena epipterygia]